MYLCDVHVHSEVSLDSDTPLAALTEAAISGGFRELCVTDHCELLDADGSPDGSFDWAAAKAQCAETLPLVRDRLDLRLGIEISAIPYDPDAVRRILREGGSDVDFVLGSNHNWIGAQNNRGLYHTDYTGNLPLCCQAMENALNTAWRIVTECADCYDSLAHVTYPLRYFRRDGQLLTAERYEEPLRAIFTEIARTDHALEVNTYRGLDVASWLPLLRWYRECGGKFVTLGSDAHTPGDVGRGIREVIPLLQAAGFDRITTYEKRRPVLHKL